jgi:hypothetical protein
MSLRAKYPVVLNEHVVGTLTISLSVSKEMQILAGVKGIDAEAMQNLLSQRFEEMLEDFQNVINLNSGEYLE